MFDHAAGEDGCGSTDGGGSGGDVRGSEAGELVHTDVGPEYGAGRDEGGHACSGTGVDDGTGHDAGARTYDGGAGDDGGGIDDGGEGDCRAVGLQLPGDAFAGAVIADGCMQLQSGMGGGECVQQGFVTEDGVIQEALSGGFERVEQAEDLEAAGAFGHIKDHAGVAGGTENDQRDGVHGAMIRKEHGNVQGVRGFTERQRGGYRDFTAGK